MMKFSEYLTLTRVNGTPVLAHWSTALVFPVAWWVCRGFIPGMVGALAFLLLMLLHECGHAFVARRYRVGVHAIRLYPVHGLCIHDMPRSEVARIAIAWGGVGAQVLLLIAAWTASKLLVLAWGGVPAWGRSVFEVLIPINMIVIFTNLLPVPPLDGATAWRVVPHWVTMIWSHLRARRADRPPSRAERERATVVVDLQLRRIAAEKQRRDKEKSSRQ